MKKFYLICSLILVLSVTVSPKTQAAVSKKLLASSGLEICWQSAVALEQDEKVASISVLENQLYILTDNNYLFCLDRNTGKLILASLLASDKMPVSVPSIYQNKAYIVAANKLFVFDLEQRAEIKRQFLCVPVTAAAAVNQSFVYLAGMDKRLHVMDSEGLHEVFKATADNFSAITSVLTIESNVIFTTSGGNVICMADDSPKRLWQFNAVDAVSARPIASKKDLYVSSRDTNLYKLDIYTGKLLWKSHTGSALTDSPRPTEKVVYQYAPNKGLYAFGAKNGKKLWLLSDATELLASDGDTAYIFDKNKACVIMDNKKGKKISSVNFASVTAIGSNIYDSKIYIMDGKNISCIQPTER